MLPHVCTAHFSQVIMALAFGALMFSQTPALNEIGFMLSFSVLWDTFVIRCVRAAVVVRVSRCLHLGAVASPRAARSHEVLRSGFAGPPGSPSPPWTCHALLSCGLFGWWRRAAAASCPCWWTLAFPLPFPVRSVVVPSIMALLGKAAWWPRKFAAPKFTQVLGIPERDVLPGPCQGARRRRGGGAASEVSGRGMLAANP
jgi:hypothetical protein